ncbi:MAG TPA: hypothetical protein VKE74_28865 [Gemmataceae bacterium]|nr:hypothetical protein [Gemmataceae bacterium]
MSQELFQAALGALREAHAALEGQLAAADDLRFPPLTNVTAGDPLGPFLFNRKLIRNLHTTETSLEGSWINEFMGQMAEVIDKATRVLFKSLGGLLALQERIAERWAAARAAKDEPPIAKPDDPE